MLLIPLCLQIIHGTLWYFTRFTYWLKIFSAESCKPITQIAFVICRCHCIIVALENGLTVILKKPTLKSTTSIIRSAQVQVTFYFHWNYTKVPNFITISHLADSSPNLTRFKVEYCLQILLLSNLSGNTSEVVPFQ